MGKTAGEFFVITSSLQGLPYMRDILVPTTKTAVRGLGSIRTPGTYEEVLQAICQRWEISRDPRDLVLIDTSEDEDGDNGSISVLDSDTGSLSASSLRNHHHKQQRSSGIKRKREPSQLIGSQEEWALFWHEYSDEMEGDRGWWFEVAVRPQLPYAFTAAASSAIRGRQADDHPMREASDTSNRTTPATASVDSTTASSGRPFEPHTQAFASLGRDISTAVQQRVNEALGRTGSLPSSGTEVAETVVSLLQTVAGSVQRAAAAQNAGHSYGAGATPPTQSNRSAAAPTQMQEAANQPSAVDRGAEQADPAEDRPMTDYERLMARSRAQGQTLNAFFGAMSARANGRDSGYPTQQHRELQQQQEQQQATDTPPSEPLRETPMRDLGPDESSANPQPEPQNSGNKQSLTDLWNQRLQEMGHKTGPQNKGKKPSADRDDGSGSSWEVVRDEENNNGGSTSGTAEAQAGAAARPQPPPAESHYVGEENNQSLSDAFTEMLKRSRGGARSQQLMDPRSPAP
ncbi:unnamed protein product [Jaminaea pallidilutea]